MANQKIKSGDIVRLKSGGPDMTVNFECSDGFECVWFAIERNDPQRGRFEPSSLELVKPATSSVDENEELAWQIELKARELAPLISQARVRGLQVEISTEEGWKRAGISLGVNVLVSLTNGLSSMITPGDTADGT